MTTFAVDDPSAAVLIIDLHRGHLDPADPTMPLAADAAKDLLDANVRLVDYVCIVASASTRSIGPASTRPRCAASGVPLAGS